MKCLVHILVSQVKQQSQWVGNPTMNTFLCVFYLVGLVMFFCSNVFISRLNE